MRLRMKIRDILLIINSFIIFPNVGIFTLFLVLFVGFSESKVKYYTVLSICIVYLVLSIALGFKRVYNVAKSDSKSKYIFFIGIIILLISLVLFFKFYRP